MNVGVLLEELISNLNAGEIDLSDTVCFEVLDEEGNGTDVEIGSINKFLKIVYLRE